MATNEELDTRTMRDALDVLLHGRPTYERTRAVRTYAQGLVALNETRSEIHAGWNFPLLRFIPARARADRERARPLIILNGDATERSRGWGGTNRLAECQAIARRESREVADTLVIPFSALNGAELDIDSIVPLAVRDDAVWTETVARRPSETPRWQRERWDYERSAYVPVQPDSDGFYRWEVTHHRLGDCVFSALDVSGRRRRFLSSFDYQESPPLYFLAELPRGALVDSVELATESLAPRAVHAARARGLEVRRQGDVFFVETRLTDDELERRGIVTRARLTQWTRDARARKGETGYRRPLRADERRRMAKFARRRFREILRDELARVELGDIASDANARRRERSREVWRQTRASHLWEIQRARELGIDPSADNSTACGLCGARPGAPCSGPYCRGRVYPNHTLERRQADRIQTLRGRREDARAARIGPVTPPRGRRGYAKARAEHASTVARAETNLRRAIFGSAHGTYYSQRDRYSKTSPYDRVSAIQAERSAIARRVRDARRDLDDARARPLYRSRAQDRDAYRRRFGENAAAALRRARLDARGKFDPEYLEHAGAYVKRRERVRRALQVYGTAHTATEVIRTRAGAVYVRGSVIHRRDIESGSSSRWDRGGDHARIDLDRSVWYLAVRNTVPRQKRRA